MWAFDFVTQLHNFNEKSQVECNQDAKEDIFDDEFDELDEIEYFESEASKLILKGDIAVIKTGDDHPYYLLKLTKDPYETQETITDSYNHKFPPYHRVIVGNYLQFHKEQKDSDLYYVDYRKTALISAFRFHSKLSNVRDNKWKEKWKVGSNVCDQ